MEIYININCLSNTATCFLATFQIEESVPEIILLHCYIPKLSFFLALHCHFYWCWFLPTPKKENKITVIIFLVIVSFLNLYNTFLQLNFTLNFVVLTCSVGSPETTWGLTCPHCTALYSTALHCTVLYSTALHCTAQHCTALHCSVQHCTALYCTALLCTALYCTALFCTVKHCTALHCTAQHCTALHWIWQYCIKLTCT